MIVPRRRDWRVACAAGSVICFAGLAVSCSLPSSDNRTGPNVTCEELLCGLVNACADGIIASCPDGHNVEYLVCLTPCYSGTDPPPDCNEIQRGICAAPWQVPGRYRCEQAELECSGCAEEGCSLVGSGGAGGSG